MGTIPAATAARMSQVASPTYHVAAGSTSSSSAASSNRSGAGFACVTRLPSTMRGGSARSSAAMDAATCSAREDVAMAQVTPARSIRSSAPCAPGSGRGSRLCLSKRSPAVRSRRSASSSPRLRPAPRATSRANARPSMPIIGSSCASSTAMPASANVSRQPEMRAGTVSTSVPSRSKITAAGRMACTAPC